MIIVIAKANAKDVDAKTKIIEFSKDLIENSRAEEGNIDYNLYENTIDGTLTFVEQWEAPEILQKHMAQEHFINFGKNIADLVDGELAIDVFNADQIALWF